MKRVSALLRENVRDIVLHWLAEVKRHRELTSVRIDEHERIDHIPPILEQLARRVDVGQEPPDNPLPEMGFAHGQERARQGYSIPLIVIEMRLLQRSISYILQRNLIRMDLSTVIADMLEVGEGLQEELEFSIRGFEQAGREAA